MCAEAARRRGRYFHGTNPESPVHHDAAAGKFGRNRKLCCDVCGNRQTPDGALVLTADTVTDWSPQALTVEEVVPPAARGIQWAGEERGMALTTPYS